MAQKCRILDEWAHVHECTRARARTCKMPVFKIGNGGVGGPSPPPLLPHKGACYILLGSELLYWIFTGSQSVIQLISSTTLQVFYQSQKLLIHVHDSVSQTLIFMLMLWFSVFTLTESFTWIHVTFKLKQVNVEAGEQHLVSTDCIYTQTHVRRNKQQDLVSGPAVTLLAEKIWPQESKKLLYTEQILNFELRQNLKKKKSFVNI